MSKLSALRNKVLLQHLFRLRDRMMLRFGLFEFKKTIKRKLFYLRIIIEDWTKKRKIERQIKLLPINMIGQDFNDSDIVVSLTSYGARVADTLPLVLYTLLTQTIKPGKIVVYLDKINWSDEKLPNILRHLQKVGVDIRYCEDIRSYKKIIPALSDFPNNPIVTVDDDFYYDVHMLEWLLNAYQGLPRKSVVGLWACIVAPKEGEYLPYNTWVDCKFKTNDSKFALYTGYGTFYPPHIFDDEVSNSDIFMKLCPTADDIWMWVMEQRLNIPVFLAPNAAIGLHTEINRVHVYFPEQNKDSLYYVNELVGNQNDTQFKNLISYYNLHPTE